jgi:MoxR-like ATPase
MGQAGPDPEVAERAEEVRAAVAALKEQMHRVIVGQDAVLDGLITAILCAGHVLVEGVPGLAKTLCVTTLARTLDAEFSRIQFTPDLLPGDLVGSEVYDPRTGRFSVRKGPVFANLVLADEINRAPAKVQSALLEAMQEKQVTIGRETHPLPEFFLVVATENPLEQEGTYPLPEAQVDRFFLKLLVPYPGREDELRITENMALAEPQLTVDTVMSPERVLDLRRLIDRVYADRRVCDYVVDLVRATRKPSPVPEVERLVEWGASPRAAISLLLAARAEALMQGRAHVLPDDVKALAPSVLRHRVILTFEAESEGVTGDEVVAAVLGAVPVA